MKRMLSIEMGKYPFIFIKYRSCLQVNSLKDEAYLEISGKSRKELPSIVNTKRRGNASVPPSK